MSALLTENTLAPGLSPKLQFAAAALLVAAAAWNCPAPSGRPDFPGPQTVSVLPKPISYRASGEFLLAGMPVDGPLQTVDVSAPLQVMKYQVTERQYSQCVDNGDCQPLDLPLHPDSGGPVTGVSFLDAEQYSSWLSRKTGYVWRLPTDQEWASLAGSKYADDAVGRGAASSDPAQRWIKSYEAESANADQPDPAVHATGHFGANEYGLADMSGNVWEWTSACYTRTALSADGPVISDIDNCGVRIAEGAHRAYVTAFIRDAKSGGCAVGTPPDHLGMRLVREEPNILSWQWLSSFFRG